MKKFLYAVLLVLLGFAAGFLSALNISISFDDILSNAVGQGATEFFNSPSHSLQSGGSFMDTGKNMFSQ